MNEEIQKPDKNFLIFLLKSCWKFIYKTKSWMYNLFPYVRIENVYEYTETRLKNEVRPFFHEYSYILLYNFLCLLLFVYPIIYKVSVWYFLTLEDYFIHFIFFVTYGHSIRIHIIKYTVSTAIYKIIHF